MKKITFLLGVIALVSMFGAVSCKNTVTPSNQSDEPAPTTDAGKAWAKAVGGFTFENGNIAYTFSKYGTKGSIDYDTTKTGGDNDPKAFPKIEITDTGAKITVKPQTFIDTTNTPDKVIAFSYEKIGDKVVAIKYTDSDTSTETHAIRKDYGIWKNFAQTEVFQTSDSSAKIEFQGGDTYASKNGFAGKFTKNGAITDLTVDVEGDGSKISKVTFKGTDADIKDKVIKFEGTGDNKKITIGDKVYSKVKDN